MSRRPGNERVDLDHAPRTLVLLYRLLSLDEVERIREAVVEGVEWLVHADAVSLWEPEADQLLQTARRGRDVGPAGAELERRLVELPGPAHSSLDRAEDPRLDQLSRAYRAEGRLCHVRPLRAFGSGVGSVAVHCLDRDELTYGELQALRQFADAAGVALRGAYQREELRRLAYTDPLTGLANRRRIEDLLRDLSDQPLSVLFIDFDGLKAVNDNEGYEVGDAVIQAIGDVLRQAAGEAWIPGRLGGDEFVVVLPGADGEQAGSEASRLVTRLDAVPTPAEAMPHFRGASVGWATAKPHNERTLLLREASTAMKAAKQKRRAAHAEEPR